MAIWDRVRPNNEELIKQAQRGNARAFEQLVDHYKDRIYPFVCGILGYTDDAEDATAIVFEKLWVCLPRYDWKASFFSYLCSIAHNTCIDIIRARKRGLEHRELPPDDEEGSPDEERYSNQESAEEVALRGEQERVLRAAITEIPPPFRETLIYSVYAELPDQEIARVMGVPVNTVKTRKNRAREKLRKILVESGNFSFPAND